MPRTIRFHLDEHVAHAVADGLRRLGIDVTTSTDAGLLGASDADQIDYGLEQGRVIFTEDDDFLSLAAAGVSHAGLVYCHQNIARPRCAVAAGRKGYDETCRVPLRSGQHAGNTRIQASRRAARRVGRSSERRCIVEL